MSSPRPRLGVAWVFVCGLLLLSTARPACAGEPQELRVALRVEFTGTSTLHDFTGRAPEQAVVVRHTAGQPLWEATASLPVAALDTGNSWRDANMRDMLEAERYPVIEAEFPSIDPALARPKLDEGHGALPFTLKIRDVTRPVVGRVTNWAEEPARVTFDVEFNLSLREFGLAAPSVMGVVGVDDAVEVHVHADVTPSPPMGAAESSASTGAPLLGGLEAMCAHVPGGPARVTD